MKLQLKNINSGNGESRALEVGQYSIGRSEENNLRLSHKSVSRKHATIDVTADGQIYLTDQQSRNGTTVNGRPIFSKVQLKPNDEIAFGEERFVLSDTAGPAAIPTTGMITMVESSPCLDSATVVAAGEIRRLREDNSLYNQKTFTALSAAGRIPVDPDNLQAVLTESLELLRETIQADRLALLEVEDEVKFQVCMSACCVNKGRVGVTNDFPVSKTVIDEILKSKVAILTQEIDSDERFQNRTMIGEMQTRSMMSVPLIDEDKTIAILYSETLEQGITFTEDHMRVLATFGDILASKILNHRLITDRQQKAVLQTELRVTKEKQTELETANRILRDTQAELVQTQKMASLKHLVAGVAHEMNNPLGALQSCIATLEHASNIISQAIENGGTDQISDSSTKPGKALTMILDAANVSKNPLLRIAAVVKSLKNFALLDQADVKEIDVHESIDSVLDLLSMHCKDKIKIIREYGTIPQIKCFGRDINQVFMNVITNAIESIETTGTITIQTALQNDMAEIIVQDTGRGIPDENISRIFDPGFTTRGVGVGTGLGLAIVHSIIETHAGKIDVKSKVGRGTQVSISIPVTLTVRESGNGDSVASN